MTRSPRWARLLLLVATGVVGCRAPTQITLELTTDLPCAQLKGTSITVGHPGEVEQKPSTAVTTQCQNGRLGALVIVPSGSKSDELSIKVTAGIDHAPEDCAAASYAGCVVARRSLHFIPHTDLTLPVELRGVCEGVACDPTSTCVKASCVKATIPDPAQCTGAGCSEGVLLPVGAGGTGGQGGSGGAGAGGIGGGSGEAEKGGSGAGGSGGASGKAGAGGIGGASGSAGTGGGGAGGSGAAGGAICVPACPALMTCEQGVCHCEPAAHCGGTCVDTKTDAANCGSCGHVCPEGGPCLAGACLLLPPPRPLAPLSTATVTSTSPTLRWVLAPGTDGALVELCKDRGCTQIITSFQASGSSAKVPMPLPVGVVFWRLTGTGQGAKGTKPSPVWQFVVHLASPVTSVDSSWGTTLDVNGDGFADVAVGGVNVAKAYVYLGEAAGLSPSPPITLADPAGMPNYFGGWVASAGDVNGDGFGDLVVGAGGVGMAYVYWGGPAGIAASPALTLTDPGGPGHNFGTSAASAGDVNGDGFGDLIIGTGTADKVYIYLGAAAGLPSSPSLTLAAPDAPGSDFGYNVSTGGDFNGDGFADLVIGARAVAKAYVYPGGPGGLAPSPVATLQGIEGMGSTFGNSVASACDVNGDGFSDVVVGANGANKAYVYLGGGGGLSPMSAQALNGPDGPTSTFGLPVASAGDVNGDGFLDLIVGADNADKAYIYLGGPAGLASMPSPTLAGPDGPGAYFGLAALGAGDVNGDGLADVVVSAFGVAKAYLYLGATTGLASSPAVTLVAPDGATSEFGLTLASAAGEQGHALHDRLRSLRPRPRGRGTARARR